MDVLNEIENSKNREIKCDMSIKNQLLLFLTDVFFIINSPQEQAILSNLKIEGYFADPSIVHYEGNLNSIMPQGVRSFINQ